MKALDLRDTIIKVCESDFKEKMYSLNYNRHNLEHQNNTYWLSPIAENPAYSRSKIFFTNGQDGKINYGLHFEKGCKNIYDPKFDKLKLQADWDWHRIISLIRKGELDSFLKDTVSQSGKPVKIDIELFIPSAVTNNPPLQMRYSQSGLESGEITSLIDLPAYLERMPNYEDSWCNIFVYQVLGKKAIAEIEESDTFSDFYVGHLKSFQEWI